MRNLNAWRLLLPLLTCVSAGCAESFVPAIVPVESDCVKRGGPSEAVVVLPNRGIVSVYLYYSYPGGRLCISQVGIVNHYPERVTVFSTQTRVYVDDGEPLQIERYEPFDARKSPSDSRILKNLPEGATGNWLFPRQRFLTRKSIRDPVVVLFYSVKGHEGFIKIRYLPMWDIPG